MEILCSPYDLRAESTHYLAHFRVCQILLYAIHPMDMSLKITVRLRGMVQIITLLRFTLTFQQLGDTVVTLLKQGYFQMGDCRSNPLVNLYTHL